MNNIDLTPIVQSIIGVVTVLITYYLIPYLKTKLSKEKQDDFDKWVRIAVQAAEQLLKATDPTGEKRKKYVLDFLKKKGYTIDMDNVEAAIEAAVYELNLAEKAVGDGIDG